MLRPQAAKKPQIKTKAAIFENLMDPSPSPRIPATLGYVPFFANIIPPLGPAGGLFPDRPCPE
jgi:hypothetical protein